ncbi:tRNA nucleotidyltransferase [Clostridiaceae bacterium JG1575]|nr:tRNA nucleotidyltransferase [Clostridiaceae bacterium JG1575]
MEINLSEGAQTVIDALQTQGFEAYLVGGSLRDALLGKAPKDWDVATCALPEEVSALFPTTIPTGILHGTVTVLIGTEPIEVTTYRRDAGYEDHRRPDEVTFVRSLSEDLKRRDFTINALAYDPTTKTLVDLFDGQKHLREHILCAVGDPLERFQEDPLRILRGIRFACVLDFTLEESTRRAMSESAVLLEHIAQERIREELKGILLAQIPSKGLTLLRELGALPWVLPELLPTVGFLQHSPYHSKDVWGHTLDVVDQTEPLWPLRLAALFHDAGKPQTHTLDEDGIGHFYGHELLSQQIAEQALERLRVDVTTQQRVLRLVRHHMMPVTLTKESKLKKLLQEFGAEDIELFFKLKEADHSQKQDALSEEPQYLAFKARLRNILEAKEPLTLSDLALNGRDLLTLGIPQGPDIGRLLEALLEEVLEDPSKNTKATLLARAQLLKGSLYDT